MGRNISHPPSPRGATPRELAAIHSYHRAAGSDAADDARRALIEAVAMIAGLIEARGRRHDFAEHYDRPHDD